MLINLWENMQELIFLIDLDKINNFMQMNMYMYLFILMTYILMLYDSSFPNFMKLFWMPLFFTFMTMLFTLVNMDDLWEWMKDLFWYTKVLNLSFIIHTCWLYWIYMFFWYYSWESACWMVSSMSFIFSLSFILFLLNYIHLFMNF